MSCLQMVSDNCLASKGIDLVQHTCGETWSMYSSRATMGLCRQSSARDGGQRGWQSMCIVWSAYPAGVLAGLADCSINIYFLHKGMHAHADLHVLSVATCTCTACRCRHSHTYPPCGSEAACLHRQWHCCGLLGLMCTCEKHY